VKIHTKRKHGYACTLRGETKLKRRSNEVGGTASSEGFFLLCQIFQDDAREFSLQPRYVDDRKCVSCRLSVQFI